MPRVDAAIASTISITHSDRVLLLLRHIRTSKNCATKIDHCITCSWEIRESEKYESIHLGDMQLPLESCKPTAIKAPHSAINIHQAKPPK